MNKQKLRAELYKNGHTYKTISEKLDITENAFWRKINGLNDFTLPEIQFLSRELRFSKEELIDIFFNN